MTMCREHMKVVCIPLRITPFQSCLYQLLDQLNKALLLLTQNILKFQILLSCHVQPHVNYIPPTVQFNLKILIPTGHSSSSQKNGDLY
jgi:hypothetical protein